MKNKMLAFILASLVMSFIMAQGYADESKTQAGPASAESSRVTVTDVSVSTGYQTVNVDGNPAKYQQYVIQPQGWFFDSLSLRAETTRGGPERYGLDVRRIGEECYWLGASFFADAPAVSADWRASRHGFVFEPAPLANLAGLANRKAQDLSVTWLPLGAISAVRAYRVVQQVGEPKLGGSPTIAYDTDRLGVDLATSIHGPPLTIAVWRENLSPGASIAQPSSRETHAEVALPLLDRDKLAMDLACESNKVSQDFVASDSMARTIQLSAVAYPSSNLVGRFAIHRVSLDQPLTVSGYAKATHASNFDLRYLKGAFSLRGGWDRRSVDHLNSNQSETTNPVQRRFYLQAKQKFSGRLALTARYDAMHLSDPPSAAVLVDPRTLYFSDTQKNNYRVDITPSERAFFYASYDRSWQGNALRGTSNQVQSSTAGAFVQLSSRASLSLDASRQKWLTPDPNLAAWLPDSRVTTASVSYAYNPETWLSVSATSTRSVGASDSTLNALGLIKEHVYEAALNHALSKGASLSVAYRRNTYMDGSETGMDYQENQVLVSVKKSF